MKLRSTRDEYWPAARVSATSVIEKVTPTTVIIEPAMVDRMARAPSASGPIEAATGRCSSTSSRARPSAPDAMISGTNQKLWSRRSQMRRMVLTRAPCVGPGQRRRTRGRRLW